MAINDFSVAVVVSLAGGDAQYWLLPTSRGRLRGVALVLVLWFVAALSVIAISLAGLSRSDMRGASALLSSVQAAAIGDAGIQLALLEMDRDPLFIENGGVGEFVFDGARIRVTVQPDTAFVNLNSASVELLVDLLVIAGKVPPDRAELLARSIEAWRNGDATGELAEGYESAGVMFRPRGGSFESSEDLLQVLGIDFDLYVRIRDLVTPYGQGSGLDDRYASLEMLRVLAADREGLAERIYEERRAGQVGVDTSLLEHKHVVRGEGTHFKISADLGLDGTRFVRSRWVTRLGGGDHSVPWASLAVETSMRGRAPATDAVGAGAQ